MCLAVGKAKPTVHVDHITRLDRGGSNDRENMQGLCEEHHKIKTSNELGKVAIGLDGWPVDTPPGE
jgi:5-methylcytosine-specific restriction endonuclease McrA